MHAVRLLIAGYLMVATLAAPGLALAQDATPGPSMTLPRCTAEPRDIDALVALWFEPSGTPAATPAPAPAITDAEALPEGSPVDDATVAAISETTYEWLSCMEVARQFARGFTFLTDRLLKQLGPDITDPTQDTPEEVRALLEAQLAATPVPGVAVPTNLPPVIGPRKPRLLDDGRVGATWIFGGDRAYFIYQQQDDGRWLIDDLIDILEPAGTPEATPTS
jgi:hypothetical protein